MSVTKKLVRAAFRHATFTRDRFCCVMCPFKSSPDRAEDELDAHHVANREAMPNGGYVKENGISLCGPCHIKAEEFYSIGVAHPGSSPEELYKVIRSSKQLAIRASERL